jgi:hypothetical protein
VDDAARETLRRVAHRSVRWWRGETGRGRTRADAVHDLVATVATITARLEGDDHGVPRRPPREDVLADQLAVLTADLVAALDAAQDQEAATEATLAYERTAAEVDPR